MNTNIKLTQILFNLIVCYCNATTLETETETIKNWPRDVSNTFTMFSGMSITETWCYNKDFLSTAIASTSNRG